jgi:hypothetical protein
MTVLVTLEFEVDDYTGAQHAHDVLANIKRLLPEAKVKPVEIDISATAVPSMAGQAGVTSILPNQAIDIGSP